MRNPILPGFYPDPGICRVGGDYYLVTSSFEFFPGVPVFHSRDLVHWRQIGHCLTRKEQLNLEGVPCSRGIYAPTIRYHSRRRRFYMITTCVPHGGHFFVHAENPAGPWSDPVRVAYPGIDPSLYFADDGSAYFQCTVGDQDGVIMQGRLDLDSGALEDVRPLWKGTGGQYAEAPHLYRIDEWYYLMIAEGGTEYGHMETIARSRTLWGPFEACPHNPILTHRSTSHPIQATGHADLVQTAEGRWWMVFLGIRPVWGRYHHLGRETFLAPVHWDANGWPVVGEQGRASMQLPSEGLPDTCVTASESVRDEFHADSPALCWNFIRNPDPQTWSLTQRPGFLRLHGTPVSLDDEGSPVFVGRRQCHARMEALCRLEFSPQVSGQEAGLCVYKDHLHHYELFCEGPESAPKIVLRERIGRLSVRIAEKKFDGSSVLLRVEADAFLYRFSFAVSEGMPFQFLGEGDVKYLSSEVTGGFTGTYLGLFARNGGAASMPPADFDWFEYRPLE